MRQCRRRPCLGARQSSGMRRPRSPVVRFVVDYGQRHAHPLNAVLHVVGVPMVFVGVVHAFLTGGWLVGSGLVVGGYVLQYLGHRAQGNEVGEVTLLKTLWRRLAAAGR